MTSESVLNDKMDFILSSPSTEGELKMIVARPAINQRKVIERGEITIKEGLKGDTWKERGSSKTDDGSAYSESQITLINSRLIDVVAGSKDKWPLAGDQLYVDFDLTQSNIPAGSMLQIGECILKVSETPHTGCGKFKERFGREALKFINSEKGRSLNLRGINASVIKEGIISTGDKVTKIETR